MKKYIFKSLFIWALLFLFSCEEYLDKAPESVLTKEAVFKDFNNAQGFIEAMYNLVVDYQAGGHGVTDYALGDDAVFNTTFQQIANIDKGNLAFWYTNGFNIFGSKSSTNPASGNAFQRPGIWDSSVQGIRKANIAIENIDLMVNATQEEKNVILGQAYFFRAFFHFEIMKWWGRFPYIDFVITDDYKLPRPATYKESALKANEDFIRAAELLPIDWDNHGFGEKTFGENKPRLTKGAAYAFQGKNLLIAASPLMKGSTNTYDYDSELAAMAVDAFAEVLKLTDQGRYALSTFENYEEVFWNVPRGVWPGGSEFIFAGASFTYSRVDELVTGLMDNKISGGTSKILSPTHNFINYNFGMANGLSIEDDQSGAYGTPMYDRTKPFENRDPRFYKWITVDGDVVAPKASGKNAIHKTAKLYTNGKHRGIGGQSGSHSGYFFKKYYPTLHSKWNKLDKKHNPWRIRMRLTDVYLMYAEALHAAKNSATIAPGSYNLTAEETINIFRDRAGIPHVNSTIVANYNKFMDELRRERTVELSFESHRWLDIRRWVVAHLPKYKRKLSLEFPEDHSNFREQLIVERICDYPKHYWLPFENNQTQFYEGFEQNPDW